MCVGEKEKECVSGSVGSLSDHKLWWPVQLLLVVCGVGSWQWGESVRLHFHNFCATTKTEKDDKSAKGTKRSAANSKALEFMQQILTYHTNTLALTHSNTHIHINCKQHFSCNSCKKWGAQETEREAGGRERERGEEEGRSSSRCPICAWASKKNSLTTKLISRSGDRDR